MYKTKLISIWSAKRAKGLYVQPHNHNYHELVYYPKGNGETTVGGNEYSFSGSRFAVIPPFVEHNEYHTADGEVICLEFDTDAELSAGISKDGSEKIFKILKNILKEAKEQDFGYRDMITLKLNELLLCLLREKNPKADEKNFDHIINYIKENYHEKLLLSDCAAQLSLSYDYFQHKFKELTGQSPQSFLIKCRLSAAEKLLKSGELSCTEIALSCGFSTSAQFSALFKREYGMSPMQYKNSGQ